MKKTILLSTIAVSLVACKQKTDMNNQTTKVPAFELSSLDSSVSPGQDFDQFANGGWKKANPVPSTESSWGAFNVLNKENEEVKIKGIIDNLVKEKDHKKGSDEQKVADMYKSYMDTVQIEKLQMSPIQDLLDKVSKINTIQDWINTHAELMHYGIGTPAEGYVSADDKNSSINTVKWVQGGLSLGDKSYYESTEASMENIRKEFAAHINKMYEMAGWKSEKVGEKILAFETAVAKIHKSNVELRDPVATYNPTNIAAIQKLAPSIDWSMYAEKSGLKDTLIITHDPKYIPNLEKLLKGTDLNTLKEYTRWQILNNYAGALPKKYRDESFHFFATIMSGVKEQKPRDIKAIRTVQSIGEGNILGKIYVKEFFPESSKKDIANMIENVRAVYKERINGLTWMSDSTKEMARKKLASFTYKIGYPDKWEDYSAIEIAPDALIENLQSNVLWSYHKMLEDIGKPVDRSRWGMSPQTINAYYNPSNNEIVFPAGILQPPFYNPDADDAINYGGIIAVIGHEFSHGFDDQGSQFDEKGNLKMWWNASDREKFDALGKAYSAYFSNFEPVKGFHVNGDLTLGENIADMGGITLAYYALVKSMEGKEQPKPIDGFTWQQRFFLGWAQVWHNNITEEALRQRIQTDPHSPAKERINGPLPHFTPFYEAFNVKEGDALYIAPEKRITIW